MELSSIFHMVVVFWIVLDALGTVPLFVVLLRHFPIRRQIKIILRECLVALAVMLAFLFGGEKFLHMLGIQKSSLQIAGGVILLLISFKMIFTSSATEMEKDEKGEMKKEPKEPMIVPLAIPSITGPGMLTMISLYAGGLANSTMEVFVALIIAWLLSVPILVASSFLKKLFGENGHVAIEKLFGYVIVLIATKVMVAGFTAVFRA